MLVELLNLEAIDSQRFSTRRHQESFRKTLFGGQVLAQALMAAGLTVRARPVHSLHAYFLRAGKTDSPVEYWVENLRDGNSVSSRQVRAIQDGEQIFVMSASFHQSEPGLEHQTFQAPKIPTPEALLANMSAEDNAHFTHTSKILGVEPIDFVPCSRDLFNPVASQSSKAEFWIRSSAKLPDNPLMHCCALAFASDLGLLATALLPHNTTLFQGKVYPASMDHSLWFHRQPDFNDWHVYATDTPWAGGARGFCRGAIYDGIGRLVASSAQEGLIRPRQ